MIRSAAVRRYSFLVSLLPGALSLATSAVVWAEEMSRSGKTDFDDTISLDGADVDLHADRNPTTGALHLAIAAEGRGRNDVVWKEDVQVDLPLARGRAQD